MRRSLRVLAAVASASAVSGTAVLVAASSASADGFTPADFVVFRVGSDQLATQTNNATQVYLDRFSSATASDTPVSSVTVPYSATGTTQHILTAAGLSRSEGQLTRSADGSLVAFAGYDAPGGTTGPIVDYQAANGTDVQVVEGLTSTDPATTPRTIGLLDGAGAVDTSTSVTGGPHVVRAAATSDGQSLWLAGSDGITTTTRGGTTATPVVTLDASSLLVQGGRLLTGGANDGAADTRLATVGTGLPTTAAALTGLPGVASGLLPGGFVLLDLTAEDFAGTGADTLYLVNQAERSGAVDKYSYNGTTWTKQGAVALDGVLGLAASRDANQVLLAATTPKGLYTFGELDATAAGFTSAAPSKLAAARGASEFRGVALAPTGDALSKPTATITTPAVGAHVPSNTTGLAVAGTASAFRGVGSITVQVDSGTPVSGGGGESWTAQPLITGIAPGTHTLTVTVSDIGETPASTTVTRDFVVDAPPAVVVTAPAASGHVSYLDSTLLTKGTATAARGISGVTVAVDAGAPAAATLSGSTWSRPISVSSVSVGTHTLTVKATEATSGAVTTTTRAFVRDGIPAGTFGPGYGSFYNKSVYKSAGWQVVTYQPSPDHRGLITTGTPYVRFISYGRGLDLRFQRRPDAGQVRINVDRAAYVVDLRSASTGELYKSFRNLSAGKHTITITALHKKSATSKGYTVVLGLFRVFA